MMVDKEERPHLHIRREHPHNIISPVVLNPFIFQNRGCRHWKTAAPVCSKQCTSHREINNTAQMDA